jgi:hypothetical protein
MESGIDAVRMAEGFSKHQALGMARVIADEADRQLVSKGDLRLTEERLMRHITEAKYDLLKWDVAAVAVILAQSAGFRNDHLGSRRRGGRSQPSAPSARMSAASTVARRIAARSPVKRWRS